MSRHLVALSVAAVLLLELGLLLVRRVVELPSWLSYWVFPVGSLVLVGSAALLAGLMSSAMIRCPPRPATLPPVLTSPHRLALLLAGAACVQLGVGCSSDKPSSKPSSSLPDDTGWAPVEDLDVQGWSLQCVSLSTEQGWLAATVDSFDLSADTADAAGRFFLQPADLATYLLYDEDGTYLVAEDGPLLRQTHLESDATRITDGVIDDDYISGAEWLLEPSGRGGAYYQLRNRRSDRLLGASGLVDAIGDALAVTLVPADGCAEHPELSLDATGSVTTTTFDDGDLYGVADTHSHLLTNFSFGGGVFHGGSYHRLGVEHALADCALLHGDMGRKDFFGYVYDHGGNDAGDLTSSLVDLIGGELSEDNHQTAGYPDFTEWPDARNRATHQAQYYRWLERAWLSGLRLVVQHATSNAVICNLMVGEGFQPSRYGCEDMTSVDRSIDEAWRMQDYIDARAGGEGLGWFRIVRSSTEARQVISDGKLAVILGIETSDLFDCHLTPRPGGPTCDAAYVQAQLDAYQARGVNALFPVHKYDNQFAPGDGSGDFIELGNFLNSGHWTNQTEDCPDDGMPDGFDGDSVTFGGLLSPRDDFLADPPNDLSGFPDAPLEIALSFAGDILQPSREGYWCQNGTLTDLGEALFDGMMTRGMIIEVDHLPMWAYQRAFQILEEHDYPAAGTHGRHWDGRIYALGGLSNIGLGRCHDPENPGSTLDGLFDELATIQTEGGYPAVGFGFDLNGFAGAPGPRFGDGVCSTEQQDPISYPFTSYAGDVQFTEPFVGNRAIDFGTEGMVHIGLLPELLEDARTDAVSETDLEPLFRSAEAYVRMWEKAELRAAELSVR